MTTHPYIPTASLASSGHTKILSFAILGTALVWINKSIYDSVELQYPFAVIAIQSAVVAALSRRAQGVERDESSSVSLNSLNTVFWPNLRLLWPLALIYVVMRVALSWSYILLPLPLIYTLHICVPIMTAFTGCRSGPTFRWTTIVGSTVLLLSLAAVLHSSTDSFSLGLVVIGCGAEMLFVQQARAVLTDSTTSADIGFTAGIASCGITAVFTVIWEGPTAFLQAISKAYLWILPSCLVSYYALVHRLDVQAHASHGREAVATWISDSFVVTYSNQLFPRDSYNDQQHILVYPICTFVALVSYLIVPDEATQKRGYSRVYDKAREHIAGGIYTPNLRSSGKSFVQIGCFVTSALAVLAYMSILHLGYLPGNSSRSELLLSALSQVRFPLYGEITRQDPASSSLALYTQRGPGLEVIPPFDPNVDTKTLPRLGWVIFANPESISKDGHTLAQIQCYCAMMGIPFYLEHRLMMDDRHLFTARHRGIAKYLRFHQWVFACDADMFIARSDIDIRRFLDDSVDVIANDRATDAGLWEVCACALFIRNSPGGWSYLRRWIAWADHRESPNYDNGDLVEIISAGLSRDSASHNADYTGRVQPKDEPIAPEALFDEKKGCTMPNGHGPGLKVYNGLFMSCFLRQVSAFRSAHNHIPYWDAELFGWTDNLPPIALRSYKVFAGFCRWGYDGWTTGIWDNVILENDFLITGKGLATHLTADAILCTGQGWKTNLTLSITEAQERMRALTYTWWPPCFAENGTNTCLRSESAI